MIIGANEQCKHYSCSMEQTTCCDMIGCSNIIVEVRVFIVGGVDG
jgi:hypothetical protein